MAQAKIYYQSDCDINVLKNKTVARGMRMRSI